jgi:hypothetical protein
VSLYSIGIIMIAVVEGGTREQCNISMKYPVAVGAKSIEFYFRFVGIHPRAF